MRKKTAADISMDAIREVFEEKTGGWRDEEELYEALVAACPFEDGGRERLTFLKKVNNAIAEWVAVQKWNETILRVVASDDDE